MTRFVPLLAGGFALLVYVTRLCPTVAMLGDSPTFTAAAAECGVPQPPGYPLFVLLGHLFSNCRSARSPGAFT